MLFEWAEEGATGRSALTASPRNYDGAPAIRSLYIGTTVAQMEPQVEAVAAALAFEAYIGAEVECERPVEPFVARALEDLFASRPVRCVKVTHAERELPPAAGEFLVTTSLRDQLPPPNVLGKGRKILLRLLPNHTWQGTAGTTDELLVSTNAEHISPRRPEDSRRLFPLIAAALILTSDFRVRGIRLIDNPFGSQDQHLQAAQKTLRSINRELILEDS